VIIHDGCWIKKEANLPPGAKYKEDSVVEVGEEGIVIWLEGEPVMGGYYDTKSKSVIKWYRDIFITDENSNFRFVDKDENNLRVLNSCFDMLRVYSMTKKRQYGG